MAGEGLKITSMTPAQAAEIMTAVYRREITADQVAGVAERYGLVGGDGRMSLLDYVVALLEDSGRG